MKLRSPVVLALFAALVLLAVPVHAQPEESRVSFDGIGFTFDATLGSSVNITQVPGQPPDLRSLSGPDIPHVAFSFYGSRREGAQVPRVGFTSAVVRVFATADIAGYEAASGELEQIRALLADRPDLAPYTTISGEGPGRLPHIPLDTTAAQALRARATYLDTSQLSGIAYLVGYRQDVAPFTAGDFWYTFQALSADGGWFISGDFVVEAGMFPERIRRRDLEGLDRRWSDYLEESTRTLDEAPPDAFAPALTVIDALVASITIDAAPGASPSPSTGG